MGQYPAIGCKIFHKKEVLIVLVVLVISLFFLCPLSVAQAYNRSSAIVLMDADNGEILYSENANVKMEIASTTKVLTAITAIRNGDVFSQVAIPKQAEGIEGSSIYLRTGETWQLSDLLYGLMLRSGNDAADAIAWKVGGSRENFIRLMNQTAVLSGATQSSFTNPHGLHDENHYSTASDMARITAFALKNSLFREIVKTKTHRCVKEGENGREKVVFYNKNKLLYSYPYAVGVKTGYTKHSGRCLISAAEKQGKTLICVVLNVGDTYGVSKSLFEKYLPADKKSE